MVAINVVERFRHQNDLRVYRRKLSVEVSHDHVLRLLPALIDLSIPIIDSSGTSCALGQSPHITLVGSPGSGRRLAFQQLATRWAAHDDPSAAVPVLIPLARIDDRRSPPATLVTECIRSTSEAIEQKSVGARLPRIRLGGGILETSDRQLNWLLLIHGWEALSVERREIWRTALLDIPHIGSSIQTMTALPKSEPAWAGFTALEIA